MGLSRANPSRKAPRGSCALPASGSAAPWLRHQESAHQPNSASRMANSDCQTRSHKAGNILLFAYQEAVVVIFKKNTAKKPRPTFKIICLEVKYHTNLEFSVSALQTAIHHQCHSRSHQKQNKPHKISPNPATACECFFTPFIKIELHKATSKQTENLPTLPVP